MSDPDPVADAERAVLGASLLSSAALTDVAPLLIGVDFRDPRHELIWDAITHLHIAGESPDPITTAAHLAATGELSRAGGPLYLHDLTASVPVTSNAGYYARIVRREATRRRVRAAGQRIVQVTDSEDLEDLTAAAIQELTAAHRPDPTQASTRVGDLVDDVIDDISEPSDQDGMLWPWVDANHSINPLSAGQLAIIAGRPGAGKSVMCVDVARHVAFKQRRPVVLHSLEMSHQEIVKRILAAEARVPLEAIQKRTLDAEHWGRISTARAALAEAPLYIVDTPNVGIVDIHASITRHDPALVVLDYIQLAAVNPRLERRQALEEFTRALKLTAKSAGIPILTAAQLGRGPEMRTDHRPQLSDLRETGGLENDADLVLLLYRPDYYDPETARAGEIDVITAKQRNGPTLTTTLIHQLHYSRIVDAAR